MLIDFIRILLNDLRRSENKEIEKGKRRSNPAFGEKLYEKNLKITTLKNAIQKAVDSRRVTLFGWK